MQNRHIFGEPGLEPFYGLGRQGYLRDEHYSPLLTRENLINRLQVNLRFPATGYAVEKDHRKSSALQRLYSSRAQQQLGARLSAGGAP